MKYTIICLILLSGTANAQSSSLNLALPTAPGNYQSDKFRSGEMDCSNAIGSATNMEFGVTGLISNGSYDSLNGYNNNTNVGDVGVYARITIPLGKRAKNRIDCNRLFELELRTKQLELIKLQRELDQLKELQFEE
tara:strand:+ start:471 stop:878 length:408 start_codon:yes stop_codon:yes gene_type:complete